MDYICNIKRNRYNQRQHTCISWDKRTNGPNRVKSTNNKTYTFDLRQHRTFLTRPQLWGPPSLQTNGYQGLSHRGGSNTTHLHSLSTLRISGAVLPLPHIPSCCVWTETLPALTKTISYCINGHPYIRVYCIISPFNFVINSSEYVKVIGYTSRYHAIFTNATAVCHISNKFHTTNPQRLVGWLASARPLI